MKRARMLHHPGEFLTLPERKEYIPCPLLPPYINRSRSGSSSKPSSPEHEIDHPLGCHRRRIPDRVVFEKLVQILVFGCAYERIADGSCSESTLRRQRS